MDYVNASSFRCDGAIPDNIMEEIFIQGYSCDIYRDDDLASQIDEGFHLRRMMSYSEKEAVSMDRYDVRWALDPSELDGMHIMGSEDTTFDLRVSDGGDVEPEILNELRYQDAIEVDHSIERPDLGKYAPAKSYVLGEDTLFDIRPQIDTFRGDRYVGIYGPNATRPDAGSNPYQTVRYDYGSTYYAEDDFEEYDDFGVEPEDNYDLFENSSNLPEGIVPTRSLRQYVIMLGTAKTAQRSTQLEVLIKVKQAETPLFRFLSHHHVLNAFYEYLKGWSAEELQMEYSKWQAIQIHRAKEKESDSLFAKEGTAEGIARNLLGGSYFSSEEDSGAENEDDDKVKHEESAIKTIPKQDIDEGTLKVLFRTAQFVVKNGPAFEAKVLEKEAQNPRFEFLLPTSLNHSYYLTEVKRLKDALHEKDTTENKVQAEYQKKFPVKFSLGNNVVNKVSGVIKVEKEVLSPEFLEEFSKAKEKISEEVNIENTQLENLTLCDIVEPSAEELLLEGSNTTTFETSPVISGKQASALEISSDVSDEKDKNDDQNILDKKKLMRRVRARMLQEHFKAHIEPIPEDDKEKEETGTKDTEEEPRKLTQIENKEKRREYSPSQSREGLKKGTSDSRRVSSEHKKYLSRSETRRDKSNREKRREHTPSRSRSETRRDKSNREKRRKHTPSRSRSETRRDKSNRKKRRKHTPSRSRSEIRRDKSNQEKRRKHTPSRSRSKTRKDKSSREKRRKHTPSHSRSESRRDKSNQEKSGKYTPLQSRERFSETSDYRKSSPKYRKSQSRSESRRNRSNKGKRRKYTPRSREHSTKMTTEQRKVSPRRKSPSRSDIRNDKLSQEKRYKYTPSRSKEHSKGTISESQKGKLDQEKRHKYSLSQSRERSQKAISNSPNVSKKSRSPSTTFHNEVDGDIEPKDV